MKQIDPKSIEFFNKQNLLVLRSATTDMAINVSYSFKGLKWTTDKNGRLIFYENAVLRNGRIESSDGKPLRQAPNVYVEKFSPYDHDSIAAQSAEFAMVYKGWKLLYTPSTSSNANTRGSYN